MPRRRGKEPAREIPTPAPPVTWTEAMTTRLSGGALNPRPEPFHCETTAEKKLYESLLTRDVFEPRYVDMPFWYENVGEGEICATNFLEQLQLLELEAFVQEKTSGFRNLMLEFFTSFKLLASGSCMYRFRNVDHTMSKWDFRQLFGFFNGSPRREPVGEYDRKEWWRQLTGYVRPTGERYNTSCIKSHSKYLAIKCLCQCFLGKEDFSRLSGPELYALWCVNHGGHVDLMPLFTSAVENVQKISSSKVAKLSMGALISRIAERHGIRSYHGDLEYKPVLMATDERVWRRHTIIIPTYRYVDPAGPPVWYDDQEPDADIPFVGDEEEEPFVPPAPRRRRARVQEPYQEPPADDGSGPSGVNTSQWSLTAEQWEMLMTNQGLMLSNQTAMMNDHAAMMAAQQGLANDQAAMLADQLAMSARISGIEDQMQRQNDYMQYMGWGPNAQHSDDDDDGGNDDGGGTDVDGGDGDNDDMDY